MLEWTSESVFFADIQHTIYTGQEQSLYLCAARGKNAVGHWNSHEHTRILYLFLFIKFSKSISFP